jgi:hypothetical protein
MLPFSFSKHQSSKKQEMQNKVTNKLEHLLKTKKNCLNPAIFPLGIAAILKP